MAKRKTKARAKTKGRPSKFDERYIDEAEKLTMLGLTDAQVAVIWGISVVTLHAWQKKEPRLYEALKKGKSAADGVVAASLFHRAKGYSHPAVKILQFEGQPIEVPYTEHYPPDTTACIFWLKNRRPDLWRDKTEVLNKGAPVDPNEKPATPLQLAREIAFALSVAMRDPGAQAPKSAPADAPTKH